MDQDTSNTPAKGSWRDKLGIGGAKREMPKISNEFKPNRNGQNGGSAPQGAQRSAPQIVTKTAPMAPRTPPGTSQARPAPRPAPQQAQPQAAPNQNQDLAVRLKAQREAAEKLAQQRVTQARGRNDTASSEKPRFSFADEEVATARREVPPARELPPQRDLPPAFVPKQQASPPPQAAPQQNAKPGAAQQKIQPLVPPRPALGGEKPIAPAYPSRYTPPPGGQQPQAGPGGGYRPLDPPAYQPPPRNQPQRPAPANYTEAHGEVRRQPPRETFEPYRRRSEPDAAEGYQDFRRGPAPARARQPAYDEESGDVFEDEAARPPRRRASAQDYKQAYRDYDEGYEEPQRRKGPWLLLLILLAAAVAAGGIIYYYLTQIKPAGQTGGNVPVITAPEQPTKVDPEPNATTGQQGTAAPGASDAQRKQIYDRILGDEAIDGNKIVPTEQQPRAVEPGSSTQPNSGQQGDAQQGTQSQPAGQAQPANQAQPGANNTANPDGTVEPLPLPLPPPPGEADQQGNLTGGSSEQVAAASAKNNQPIRNPEPASAEEIISPIPGENDPPAKPEVKAVEPAQANNTPPAEPEQDASATPEKPAEVKKPAAKAKAEKAKKKEVAAAVPEQNVTAEEPLVLVPPAQPEPAQAEKKSGPFFGLFAGENKRPKSGTPAKQRREDTVSTGASKGNWQTAPQSAIQPETQPAEAVASDQVSSITSTTTGEPQHAQPAQVENAVAENVVAENVVAENVVVAEAEPLQPTGVEEKTKPLGKEYVAQLASFRTEAEAMAEYNRLRQRHGGVLNGLQPTVTASTISGSARYRLGVGPLASREQASNICNSLISAGERDCLVRGN